MSKGIILAGGHGTRLRPLTLVTNKHLLPIYDKPMIMFPIETLKSLGIKDILIVSGGDRIGQFTELLGDGSRFDVEITYKVQEKAGGIADALGLGKNFVGNNSVTVILGDNIFDNKAIPTFPIEEGKAYMFVKEVKNPERFGVVSYTEEGYVGDPFIIEKPKVHVGNQAVVGLYIYPSDVFEFIPTMVPSARGEKEVTDINNFYLSQKRGVIKEIKGFWSDAGTFESLIESSNWVRKQQKR